MRTLLGKTMSDKENQDFYEDEPGENFQVELLGSAVKHLVEKGKDRGYIRDRPW